MKETPTGYYVTEAEVVGIQSRPRTETKGGKQIGIETVITVRSVLRCTYPGREMDFHPVHHNVTVVTTFEE